MSFPLTLHCKRQSRGEGWFWRQQLYPVEGEREPLMVGSEQDPNAALRELTLWWGGRQEAPKRSVLETVLWGWAGLGALGSGLLGRRGIQEETYKGCGVSQEEGKRVFQAEKAEHTKEGKAKYAVF